MYSYSRGHKFNVFRIPEKSLSANSLYVIAFGNKVLIYQDFTLTYSLPRKMSKEICTSLLRMLTRGHFLIVCLLETTLNIFTLAGKAVKGIQQRFFIHCIWIYILINSNDPTSTLSLQNHQDGLYLHSHRVSLSLKAILVCSNCGQW